jgi:hypothetical protein
MLLVGNVTRIGKIRYMYTIFKNCHDENEEDGKMILK